MLRKKAVIMDSILRFLSSQISYAFPLKNLTRGKRKPLDLKIQMDQYIKSSNNFLNYIFRDCFLSMETSTNQFKSQRMQRVLFEQLYSCSVLNYLCPLSSGNIMLPLMGINGPYPKSRIISFKSFTVNNIFLSCR